VSAPRPEEDSSGWYISWRMSDFKGKFSLTEPEFRALSTLYPLIVQIKRGRFHCVCVNSADQEGMNWALCAIRNYQYFADTN